MKELHPMQQTSNLHEPPASQRDPSKNNGGTLASQKRRHSPLHASKSKNARVYHLFVLLFLIASFAGMNFYIASQFVHNNVDGLLGWGNSNNLPRVLAIVFPQFHEDRLNNYIWGKGFNDWNNLNKAPATNRLGNAIPRPTSLGFYNYTQLEPRKKQGELAKEYGIDGFVFHHYWFYDDDFHKGPDLHQPLVNMLEDGHPNVPFALHWCAAKWTTTWSGKVDAGFVFKEGGVLKKQYFPKNDEEGRITEHYNWLRQFFRHPNYIKVDGKPVLMMYQKKPGSFPVLKIMTRLAMEDGFPGLYLTVGLSKPHDHLLRIGNPNQYKDKPQTMQSVLSKFNFDKVLSYPSPAEWNVNKTLQVPNWCKGKSRSEILASGQDRLKDMAGIISSFDNTPRRDYDEANVWSSGTPDEVVGIFRKSLRAALYYEMCCFPDDDHRDTPKEMDDRFVIINSMNEWAEGMALEPSDVYGYKFLETIRDTKLDVVDRGCSYAQSEPASIN